MSRDAPAPPGPDAASRGLAPADPGPVEVTAPATSAGGWPAVASTLRHLRAAPGLARGGAALLRLNQAGGFDCPGCAWPETDRARGLLEFCENGAKAVAAETTRARADRAFFARHTLDALAARSDLWLEAQGRLVEPMLFDPARDPGHYLPVSWDEAFAIAGGALRALPHPDQAAFYTSGRTSNEAAFLYQLFVRRFGTNNLPDCSNLCHESSGVALKQAIGVGKGTVQLEDFELADLIFVIGQNPGTNHPRMLVTLQEAAERGATIVAVNPLPEAGLLAFSHPQHPLELLGKRTSLARHFLQVRIGGDGALFQGLAKALLEREAARPGTVLDHGFLARHTTGLPELAAHLRALTWDEITETAGVTRAEIETVAEVAARARRTICCWAMGLTQHARAVATIQDVVSFLLLRGNLGRPGAGVCPVRGHSNVQGDRTMGICEKPPVALLDALAREFGFAPPRAHGLDVVETIRALAGGRVRVLVALGGNFLAAAPDTRATAAALARAELTVHVATKLNRAHLVPGRRALLLPCLGRSERDVQDGAEQFVTVEDSMGRVHASRGHLAPASPHLRSEVAIVAGLAQATLGDAPPALPWAALAARYARIRAHIARVVPGFADFEARVQDTPGFALPNPARERRFDTEDGRARFFVHPLALTRPAPGQLTLMTIRSHDQYNTTIYGLDDRYRGVRGGRRVVLVHPDDLATLGLSSGARVDVTSHFHGERRTVHGFRVIPYPIARGCAAAYFPEANPLVPLGSTAAGSNTPTSKAVAITLAPAAD